MHGAPKGNYLDNDLKVMEGDIRKRQPEVKGPYDLVTMFNPVYYFTLQEGADLFNYLRGLLSPGGVLAVASNFASRGKDPNAADLNLPSLEGLSQEPMDCGFTK